MRSKQAYHARLTTNLIPAEFVELVKRRTEPFLDSSGMDRPLSVLLREAYIQGMRDAAAALSGASQ